MKKTVSVILAALLLLALIPVSVFAGGEQAPKDVAIHEVNIEGFIPPVIGSTPEFSYTLYIPEGEPYYILYQYWHDNTTGGDMFLEQEPFVASHMYSIGCIVCPSAGYYFDDDCVFSFNGDPELMDPEFLHTYYLFPDSYVVQTVAVAPVESLVIPGDVDGDGEVSVGDALLALRAGMGLIELTDMQVEAADVNGDGEVTLSDALLVLRLAMGLISL